MSDKDSGFLQWKIDNGMYGWDHEYADLIDKAHDIGVDSGIAELTRLQADNEVLRERLDRKTEQACRWASECEALRADAERFRFLASRAPHKSNALIEYELACISGRTPPADEYRSAVDAAMASAIDHQSEGGSRP